MRIGELARRAGVSIKAVRYYERIGLIEAHREPNGYRDFEERHVRAVREIRELGELGIAPGRTAPFVECLETGHEHGDECVTSLAVYRDAISELDRSITALDARRRELQRRLDEGASHGFPEEHEAEGDPVADYTILPEGLPVPEDDGAAEHLPGLEMPALELPTSDGGLVRLDALGTGRTVIYLYPLTGRPGVDLPEGWDGIPGARGCSTEACDFRDHFEELRGAGAQRVYGLSSQSPEYQAEVADRLRLPFAMISDAGLALADALGLPTFAAPGHERLYARLTLIVADGEIEHVFYPIFPPSTHAQQVLAWLQAHPRPEAA
ncbi:MerR family DNA-binding transcriptional regulator [Leucobacter celer]|uniref:MerR family DNA-binding transcriptional regulator n=1 Tax=Leucobacter celer TaxID=668625 RepID=UPI0006A79582|nr:MerR family DNA-binding transcriptional regulator [Leucobacter celer]